MTRKPNGGRRNHGKTESQEEKSCTQKGTTRDEKRDMSFAHQKEGGAGRKVARREWHT